MRTSIQRRAVVACGAGDMYTLVNDIEAYPEFLPGCADAQILEREPDAVVARLTLAKAGVRQSFTTLNRLSVNEAIDISLVDGPFKFLHGRWAFTPLQTGRSEVALNLDFEFQSRLWALAMGKVFNQVANTMVETFCRRARAVYGQAP